MGSDLAGVISRLGVDRDQDIPLVLLVSLVLRPSYLLAELVGYNNDGY